MRALFLISGEIRGNKAGYNIEWIKKCLPDIDVKCITWDRGVKHDFVDKYYDEPKATYWPENEWNSVKIRLNRLRELKDSGAEWPPLNDHNFELVTQRFSKSANNRNRWKKRHFQLLQHALGVDDFGDGYDVIIRGRFDHPYRNYDHVKLALEYLNISENTVIEVRPSVNIKDHEMMEVEHLSHDFMIIHHKEAFDTEYVWKLHENKKLHGAESGWNQTLQIQDRNLISINGHRCKEVGMFSIVEYFARMNDLNEEEKTFYERYKEQEEKNRS